jgi:hypothetical protein
MTVTQCTLGSVLLCCKPDQVAAVEMPYFNPLPALRVLFGTRRLPLRSFCLKRRHHNTTGWRLMTQALTANASSVPPRYIRIIALLMYYSRVLYMYLFIYASVKQHVSR